MRVAYFTAGSHGAGHLVRGVALWRAFQRQRADVQFRLFAPASGFDHIAADVHERVVVDAAELRDPSRARSSRLATQLAAFAPDVLVVDLFWVPLAFVPLPCPAWLLLRSVPGFWLVGPKEARFDATRFERVLAIEPAPGLERFEAIPPVVVANRDERRSRAELCTALAADPARPLHLVATAGLPTDEATLAGVTPRAHAQVRVLQLATPVLPFPLAPWLAALEPGDQLVAAPGYNTFWEAQWLGFAQRTAWVPIKRVFDDAAWRAQLAAAPLVENGADWLARQLASRALTPSR